MTTDGPSDEHYEAIGLADRLLTTEQLAAYLDVPVATIYAWRCRKEGPHGFRVGKHVRFRWSDVQRWIGDQLTDAQA